MDKKSHLDLSQIRADLFQIISDVLEEELPPIANDTPILDFVLSSLQLVEGMRRIYEHFGVLISIRRVLEEQATLESIAAYIQIELTQNKKKNAPAEPANTILRQVLLAPSQRHISFLMRYSHQAAAAFNESLAVQLDGPLDGPALQAAVDAIASRYEALQTSLNPEKDELNIHAGSPIDMQVSQCDPAQINTLLKEIVSRPFASGERFFKAELLRISDDRHVLALVSHGLVVEAEALQIILKDLASHYTAYCEDAEPQAEIPVLQWTDYLAMGETDMGKTVQKISKIYWQDNLPSAIPRLELPGDYSRPAIKRYAGDRLNTGLEEALTHQIEAWADSLGITVKDVLFGMFSLYLSRLSGQKDLIIGLRSAPLYIDFGQQTAAQTRNMLPIHSHIYPNQSFHDHILAQAESLASAEEHPHYSLAEIIQFLQLPRDQSRSALFTAAYQYQSRDTMPSFGPLNAAYLQSPAAGARYDLELIVTNTPKGIKLVFEYNTELFETNTIARWIDGMLTLLQTGLSAPATPCKLLPAMPDQARKQLLEDWNKTEQSYPKENTVLELFQSKVIKNPDALAVSGQDFEWSYLELKDQAQAFAAALLEQGVVSGDRVGILMARGPDTIAAILGTWMSGAVYVPMDQLFPKKRLAYMLDDSGVRIMITHQDLVERLPKEYAANSILAEDIKAPKVKIQLDTRKDAAEHSAYIMYTSGSTGQPKGVEVKHRSLLNLLISVKKHFGFNSKDVMLAISTISFDISLMELLMPLIAGGAVDIASDGIIADGFALAELINQNQPDFMQATPSIWKTLLTAGWQGLPDLRICSTGENLNRELAEQLLKHGAELWNLYGPTETTVYAAIQKIESDPDQPISIGRPITNMQIYILDEFKMPVPLGVIGDLYIGGDGLAHGYWNKPSLTTDSFIQHPFKKRERLYRTGDLARYKTDGSVICLGRIDDQVKIHGVRIELGEIESTLRNLSGVKDTIVTTWEDHRGDIQLVGHIIPEDQPPISTAEIRKALRHSLPEVMIPPHLLFTDQFPLTANGKVRRADLPAPNIGNDGKSMTVTPPETSTERLLAKAWALILGISEKDINRNSDFMDLGGHSLLMTPLMLEIKNIFQVKFSLSEFFGASTIQSFGELIDKRRHEKNETLLAKQPTRSIELGRQRMAFLLREAQLPSQIAPARGTSYNHIDHLKHVFVTGGTGFLGAYLIAEILKTTDAQLYCLVRPKRGESGKRRIENQMRHYDLWDEDTEWLQTWQARLQVIEGDVTLPRLGMADDIYDKLAYEVEAIIHGAAHVNFIYPYEALRATNVLGIHEVLRFAFHSRIKQVHHLSTAAIWPMGAQYTFYEKDPIEHGKILNLGYDEAKWVGERCLMYAEERGLPVARYRPGEVGGDSVTGHCVVDHFLIASIKGFLQLGAFPALDIELDVAPVDYVAKAITHLIFKRNPLGRAFHLTNPYRHHISEALAFLSSLGYQFEEMRFEELRNRLIGSRDFYSNELFAYQAMLQEMDDLSLQIPTYDTHETRTELAGSGISCPPADEKLFATYMRYLQDIDFIPRPEILAAKV